MSNTFKIYFGLLLIIIVGIIIIDSNIPKPIDWTASYDTDDKIPYGLYVFDKEIVGFFKDQKVEKVTETPYEFFSKHESESSKVAKYTISGTYIYIKNYSDYDTESCKSLLQFVKEGHTVFLSHKVFPKTILDTLHVELKQDFHKKNSTWMANPNVSSVKYDIAEESGNYYFSKIDTLKTLVLGYQSGDSTRVNYIKVPFGKGQFLLHSLPISFTNFYLLKNNNYEYSEKVLSYNPKSTIYWHTKNQKRTSISSSPMRFILSKPALQWAWYFVWIGLLLFVIFNSKRRQRSIPILEPLTNSTIEFTQTIGNLYFQEGDINYIFDKKIIYFLERIRTEFLIDTTHLDEHFIKKLHQKSNKNLIDIEKVVFLIQQFNQTNRNATQDDLIALDRAIEKII